MWSIYGSTLDQVLVTLYTSVLPCPDKLVRVLSGRASSPVGQQVLKETGPVLATNQ